MGVKEAYLDDIDQYLEQFWLDLEELKVKVEKKSLGADPAWLADFHSLQEKGKHLAHIVEHMRKHTDGKSRHADRLKIETACDELKHVLHHASRNYLGEDHPHPQW